MPSISWVFRDRSLFDDVVSSCDSLNALFRVYDRDHLEIVSGKKLAVVPILRAGLGMADGFLQLVPMARVGHIGLYRDHNTLKPVDYYFKVPGDAAERDFFVLDPMLATGGSAASVDSTTPRSASARNSEKTKEKLKQR